MSSHRKLAQVLSSVVASACIGRQSWCQAVEQDLERHVRGGEQPERDEREWGADDVKSYWVPAIDIVGFDFLLNQFDRHYEDEDTYATDFSSISENLHHGWTIDSDPFATNQFLHPYQGSLYHGFARSAGLGYWQSLIYDFAGSALWEVAGETTPPSLNDQITTSFGGSFLGEALFRAASLLLEEGGPRPSLLRELGAAVTSPATGFNRLAWGDRFDGVFPAHEPATLITASVGERRSARVTDTGVTGDLSRDNGYASVALDYGLPGKVGYEYSRPFDYFQFELTAISSVNALPEQVSTRGLLYGKTYSSGEDYRAVWGLYGSYDYIAPEIFSVSSTALSIGSTGQLNVSDAVTLQGTGMAGLGWAAVGTIADAQTDRDYQYGASPQAVLDLRLLFGERAMLAFEGRDWYVSDVGSDAHDDGGNILRGRAALTVRLIGHHALTLQFVSSSRVTNTGDLPDSLQNASAASLGYTYLSDTHFGVVRW
jgi:hypothetical protein